MRTRLGHYALIACAALLAVACKSDDKQSKETPSVKGPASKAGSSSAKAGELDFGAIVARVGVGAGGWTYGANVGAEGVVTLATGDVAVRRVGLEEFAPLGDKRLYPGDVIRTATGARATVTLSDDTVVELAEDTAIAVGDRNATADPASAAAVLMGVARFSVSDRAKGEGPFLVYTPGAVIGTRGTTYAVGVAASGDARVGVEQGEVEIAGTADLERAVPVPAGKAATVDPKGTLGAPTDFAEDDWGDWTDAAVADATPEAVLDGHAARLAALEPETDAEYAELDKLTTDASSMDDAAKKAETAGDDAAYQKAAPERGAVVEASFAASVRLNQLTYAMLAHSYLARQLYVRHPKKLEKKYNKARPRVVAALLYQKKFHAVVTTRVKPIRGMYYRYHPRGRAQVAYVGVKLTPFARRQKLAPIPRVRVRKHLRVAAYYPPRVRKFGSRRRLVVGPPRVGWTKTVRVRPRRYRTKRGWYRPPARRRGRLIGGVTVVRAARRVFGKARVAPRGRVRVHLGRRPARAKGMRVGPGTVRVHKRGANKTVRVGPGGVSVKVKRPSGVTRGIKVGPRGGIKMGVKGPGGRLRKGVKIGPRGKVKAVKRGRKRGRRRRH